MSYVVRTTPRFEKDFKKLDRYTMKMIKAWIEKNLSGCEKPQSKGKSSHGKSQRSMAVSYRRLQTALPYRRRRTCYSCFVYRSQARGL